jgi:hypothetical protein
MDTTSSVRLGSLVFSVLWLAGSAMAEQAAVDPACRQAAQARQNNAMRKVTLPLAPALSRVSCTDRTLAIYAEHARLNEILDRVAKCTGATVDVPAGADDIVTTRIGPAPPLQVLMALLDRSRFDFSITSATGDASDICVVKLIPRSSAPSSGAPDRVREAAAADRAAQIVNLTGGDEGVWDGVEVGTPVTASAKSVPEAALSAPTTPSKPPARKDRQ